jgi:hypothetical protein
MQFVKSLILIFVIFPTLLFAHGPTRQKVTEFILIEEKVDKVWEIVGDFDKIGSWHSEYKSITGNEDLKDVNFFNSGNGKIEILSIDNDVKNYKYRLKNPGNIPVNNYSGRVLLQTDENVGSVKVILKGAFYRKYVNNDPPPGQDDEAAIIAVQKIYKDSLLKLKSLAETK